MDLLKVLTLIAGEFKERKVSYALIGGFALGLYGVVRSTNDLDFLVDKDDLEKVDAVMQKYSYQRSFRSENVSQFVSDIAVYGQIDFLHAFRSASRHMLKRAVKKAVFKDKLKLPVVKPEDLIGLKLQAMANAPQRSQREMSDIRELIVVCGAVLDWKLLKDYFSLFSMNKQYQHLREDYGQAD